MWHPSVSYLEIVIRAVVVYGFMLLMLRLTGKRQVGQLAPFDLVLLLVISNAVQNSMNAGDNSLVGGLVSVFALLAVNGLMGWITFKSKKAELFIEGKPQVLIHNGILDERMVRQERLTQHEIMAAIRQAGVTDIEHVRVAIMETNGHISVIPKNHT